MVGNDIIEKLEYADGGFSPGSHGSSIHGKIPTLVRGGSNLSTVFFHNLSVQSVNNNLEQQAQAIFANRFLSLATLFTIDSPLNFT